MQKKNHAQISQELIQAHQILCDLIGTGPFHFVDVPLHGNIGDLLIMLGTLAFFKKNNLQPRLLSPYFSFRTEWVKPGETIVFQGGGNFGDLYAPCHRLRERVTLALPKNRIIILPQSIQFITDLALQQSARLFRSHPDLHICVRDAESFEIAKQFSSNVYLLPDMAHQLYPLSVRPKEIPNGLLLIDRLDTEKSNESDTTQFSSRTDTDWPMLVGKRELFIDFFRKVVNRLGKMHMGQTANQILMPIWIRYAAYLANEATELFAAHQEVVSDRLHGHILAFVMSMPNTVLDNSYHKNSRYLRAWTAGSPLVRLQPATPGKDRP